MSVGPTRAPDRPADASVLDRFLRLFTEVRAGEGLTAILLGVNVFVLLATYHTIKVDTFIVRAGDLLPAGLVFSGTTWLAFRTEQFVLVNLALALVWVVLAVFIGIEYWKRPALPT